MFLVVVGIDRIEFLLVQWTLGVRTQSGLSHPMPEGIDDEFTGQIEEKDARDPLEVPVMRLGKCQGKEPEPTEKCHTELECMSQVTPDEEVKHLSLSIRPLGVGLEEQRRRIVFHTRVKTMNRNNIPKAERHLSSNRC